MKLTWENNKGDTVIVIYGKDLITDNEVKLDPHIAVFGANVKKTINSRRRPTVVREGG